MTVKCVPKSSKFDDGRDYTVTVWQEESCWVTTEWFKFPVYTGDHIIMSEGDMVLKLSKEAFEDLFERVYD